MAKKTSKPKAMDAAEEFINTIDFKAIDPAAEYSTEIGAGLIKISPRRLRGFCKEGRLGRRQVAGGYVMTGAELIAFGKTPRPTGRAGRILKAAVAGGAAVPSANGKPRKKPAKKSPKKSGKNSRKKSR